MKLLVALLVPLVLVGQTVTNPPTTVTAGTGADLGAQINAALVSFGAIPRCGTVTLPNGSYTIATTIGASSVKGRHGCRILGQGSPQQASSGTPGTTHITWGGAVNGTIIQIIGCYNCEVSHFSIDGGSTASSGLQVVTGVQQFHSEDMVIRHVRGTNARSLEVGASDNVQVSESNFTKIFILDSVTAIYQTGINSVNNHFRDLSVSGYDVAGMDVEAGDLWSEGNTFTSAVTGATATFICKATGNARFIGDHIETSTSVPFYSFPGTSGVTHANVVMIGEAASSSFNGLQIFNYTQNGTITLLGNAIGGTNATATFNPIGGGGRISALYAAGNTWGRTTVFTASGSNFVAEIHDGDATSAYAGALSHCCGALYAGVIDKQNIEFLNSPITQYDGTTRWDYFPSSSALSWYKGGVLAGGWDSGTANASGEWDANALGLKGTVNKYSNVTTAGLGVAAIYAATEINQATSQASTSLLCGGATCPAGKYRLSFYGVATDTRAGATLTAAATWRDGGGATIQRFTSPVLDLSANTNYLQSTVVFRNSGATDIKYSATLVHTATYLLDVVLERLW